MVKQKALTGISKYIKHPPMDILLIMVIIGTALLFYQLVLRKDRDELDRYGHPVRSKRK